jgi:hypothetical protein
LFSQLASREPTWEVAISSCARTTLIALALATLCSGGRARAQDDDAEPSKVVMIAPQGDQQHSRRTAEAVEAQLADLPVTFDLEWVEAIPPELRAQVDEAREVTERRDATAVFWADPSQPDQLFLYIADPEGGRVLIRSISSAGGGAEARLETVAVIIRAAVKAVLAGGTVGVEAPPEEPEEPSGPTGELDVFVSYALVLYSNEVLTLHGARLGLSARLAGWARAYLAYRLQWPLSVEDEYVGLDVSPHPMELGAAGRFHLGDWYVEAAVGLMVDVVTVDVTALEDQVLTRSVEHRWLFGATPSLSLGRALGRIASIYLAVSADVLFNEHWYAVETPDGTQTVLRPWTVRPVFRLGALFTLL